MGRKKGWWKRQLAILLCAANVLGQILPVAAQEEITVSENNIATQEGEVTETVSGQELTANIALGKRATASSEEANTVSANNAVDGNNYSDNSRWGSNRGEGPHWIYIDLEKEMDIRTVAVFWENRKATSYKIQVADSLSNPMSEEDWRTVKECKTRPASITDVIELNQTEKGRYVRLLIESFTSQDPDGRTEWNTVSVYEIEIYGGEAEIQIQNPAVNVAKGKRAVSSSQEADNFNAATAVDGDTAESRWSSARGDGPHWIYVDLGKSMDVKSFRIFWETRKATNYKIQIAQSLSASPQENEWTTVQSFTSRPESKIQIINLANIKRARYVRLYIENFDHLNPDDNISWNTISIYELEVYGGNAPGDIMETASISFVQPQPGDRKLELILPPREGATVKYNGTDYEQLIDDELNIYQPIVDMEAVVSVKVTNDNNPSQYVFKEMQVTIPGQYPVEEGDNPAPKVLPELREWKGTSGSYRILEESRIVYKEEELKTAAEALARDYQVLTGESLRVVKAEEAEAGDIFFRLTKGKGLFKEGYLMNITDRVVVEAEESTGAYWATRTILQSIKKEGSIPQGIARDYPLYEVRGLILDVGRKTFSMDYLKQTVQELAWYKMNDFQIHLNDNYIWLENYSDANEDPMTAYSGFRLESDIKKGGNNGLNQADLTNTDVFYTKDEFREFMQTAKECGVNIVPEIDVPAHSLALTKVRPDLRDGTNGRQNDHLALSTKFDECVDFVQSIFDEYMGSDLENPVFDPDATIHIGCDEYEADAAAFRRFCNSMIEYVQERGRKVRFWGSLTRLQS
ncbi:MAG: discoidin domain-containing protein [Lachnospiraceae bacterium]|nr:discoidin domain-containing protein [Lachnospiraceae bacterium]